MIQDHMNKEIVKKYNDMVDTLKIKLENLINLAEKGKETSNTNLKFRTESVSFRKLLKEYRIIALEYNKELILANKEINRRFKIELDKSFENIADMVED